MVDYAFQYAIPPIVSTLQPRVRTKKNVEFKETIQKVIPNYLMTILLKILHILLDCFDVGLG